MPAWPTPISRLSWQPSASRSSKPAVRAPQRPLWASTSTKNPAYRDVIYVEELIGPDTVNTMPPQTLVAFLEHGQVRPGSLEEDMTGAQPSAGRTGRSWDFDEGSDPATGR